MHKLRHKEFKKLTPVDNNCKTFSLFYAISGIFSNNFDLSDADSGINNTKKVFLTLIPGTIFTTLNSS